MPAHKGFLTSLLELVRLPNVFTAPSDVAMGMAVSGVALTSSHTALLRTHAGTKGSERFGRSLVKLAQ